MFNKRNSVLCIMMILAMVGATGCSYFTSPVKPTSDTSSDKANENKSPETANGSTATPTGREFAGLNW